MAVEISVIGMWFCIGIAFLAINLRKKRENKEK